MNDELEAHLAEAESTQLAGDTTKAIRNLIAAIQLLDKRLHDCHIFNEPTDAATREEVTGP